MTKERREALVAAGESAAHAYLHPADGGLEAAEEAADPAVLAAKADRIAFGILGR